VETLNFGPRLAWLSVLRTVWKRKLLIALVAALVGGLAMAVVFALPAVYRAQAVILVESQRIPERFVTSTVSSDLNDRLSNLKQQILSYSRLLTIIQKYNLYRDKRQSTPEEEIIEMMRRDTGVELERGWSTEQPGAFRITYEGREPAVVAQVANELAELFIDQNLRSREVNAVGTAEFLEDQLAEAKRRLEEQEARLTEYKRTHNGELPQQENALNASLSRLQLQLQSVQEQISRAQQNQALRDGELETAQTSRAAVIQMTEQAAEGTPAGATAAAAQKDSALIEKQLAALQSRYTASHPDVKALSEILARTRLREAQSTAAETAPVQGAATKNVTDSGKLLIGGTLLRERERVEQLKTLRGIAVKQIEDAEAERVRVLREMAALEARMRQLPVREQQMTGLLRDYEISKANYQSLLNKQLAARMATEMERNQKSERFTVLDSARIPEKPVRPDRTVLSGAGWLIGLVLSIGAAFAVELRRNVLLGEWELPEGTPVLGRVPRIDLRPQDARRTKKRDPASPLLSGRAVSERMSS
jgi:succinoglycan biosynthesis transport protein ExoP